jgi:hypothetical protein
MPEIDISKLARLDERDALPERPSVQPLDATFARPDAAFAPSAAAPPAAAFAPPGEPLACAGDDDAVLGVERSTRAIRIANEWKREAPRVAVTAPPPPRPRARIGGVVLAALIIAAVGGGVFGIVRYQRAPAPQRAGGVSIQIIAHPQTEVTIDGQRAGKTPLTLQRPPSRRPIQIATPRVVRQIIPDRDQVVDVSP